MAQKKTPAQRAAEALGVAERRVKKTTDAVTKAEQAVTEAKAAAVEAQKRLDYVAQNPDLPDEVRATYTAIERAPDAANKAQRLLDEQP